MNLNPKIIVSKVLTFTMIVTCSLYVAFQFTRLGISSHYVSEISSQGEISLPLDINTNKSLKYKQCVPTNWGIFFSNCRCVHFSGVYSILLFMLHSLKYDKSEIKKYEILVIMKKSFLHMTENHQPDSHTFSVCFSKFARL